MTLETDVAAMKIVIDKLAYLITDAGDHYEFNKGAMTKVLGEVSAWNNIWYSMVELISGSSYKIKTAALGNLASDPSIKAMLGLCQQFAWCRKITRDSVSGKVTQMVIDYYDSDTNYAAHDGSTGLVGTLTKVYTYESGELAHWGSTLDLPS